MRIDVLVVEDSPRLEGVDMDHVHALAEVHGHLPPILVHRGTMKVIDGMHRLMAAELRGCSTVEVRFFDGSEDEAFVKAVQANVAHGLPLTLADRTAAAARIVKAHAEWSDRRIAGLVGLSPKTVGAVRMRSTEEIPQPTVRIGRDGKARRLPAQRTGSKLSVAPGGEPNERGGTGGKAGGRSEGRERRSRTSAVRNAVTSMETLQSLRQDPAFRQTDTGRFLLRLLDLHLNQVCEWNRLIAHVPPHRANSVANLARECSQTWREFAEQVSAQSAEPDALEPAAK
ncbi:ParB/RepB/Spo0J family partition protein [Amycolatopsis halotolerans]|uniref:ParB/RepB/Spo0J family partition protein n=2 Tax=Amycolatopsis halotolerans TaxID=330083 RepID=A0ABV7QLR2_9PSEU